VVVMRPRPGRVLEDVVTNLPRPRDRQSAAFDFAKRRVMAALDRSLERIAEKKPAREPEKAGQATSHWW